MAFDLATVGSWHQALCDSAVQRQPDSKGSPDQEFPPRGRTWIGLREFRKFRV